MKMFTIFKAMEISRSRIPPYSDKDRLQYLNLRDGLIRRFERKELQIENLKARVQLLEWDESVGLERWEG